MRDREREGEGGGRGLPVHASVFKLLEIVFFLRITFCDHFTKGQPFAITPDCSGLQYFMIPKSSNNR